MTAALCHDIQGLAQAIAHCHAGDAMRCQFKPLHWDILASYMQPFTLNSGQVLMEQGALDRTLYFIESGTLTAHYEDEKACVRMALAGAGTVLGEGTFFSHLPRHATVHTSTVCKLWCLTEERYLELARQHSPIALELTRAMGAVMAYRLYNRPRRVAVT
ncbi:MAG: Crp/Fnr family transcriptional regulator [Burkholderiales bacterium RIFCSPHIGHO2_12_FULL_61_11]|nr:MAG: Crp/Fnr family transcriptional regulator [Burkholderiales bacterium RIFCSPHIGHO2_12_FULL_61_11]